MVGTPPQSLLVPAKRRCGCANRDTCIHQLWQTNAPVRAVPIVQATSAFKALMIWQPHIHTSRLKLLAGTQQDTRSVLAKKWHGVANEDTNIERQSAGGQEEQGVQCATTKK